MRTVCFRVDFGSGIGLGHLARTLPIASAVANLGMKVLFLSRRHTDANPENFKSFPYFFIGEGRECRQDDHQNWLGVTVLQDAEETLKYVPENSVIYVDHYSITREWHQRVKSSGRKVMSIDDFVIKEHGSDTLLDYNVLATETPYDFAGRKLLGPSWFPVNHGFKKVSVPKASKSLLLSPGSCSLKILENILQGLEKAEKKWERVTILHREAERLPHFPQARKISFTNQILEEYRSHDFVMGTAGVAFLERSLLGCPQLTFLVTDNQRENSRFLKRSYPGSYGGDLRTMTVDEIIGTLNGVQFESPENYIVHIPNLDDQGALRVAKELQSL